MQILGISGLSDVNFIPEPYMDLSFVYNENWDYLETFLRCLIFLRHSGKTAELIDWHQGNTILMPFLF